MRRRIVEFQNSTQLGERWNLRLVVRASHRQRVLHIGEVDSLLRWQM